MSDKLREALQNASGFLDTPVSRRKFGDDPFYADVVASIRAALAQPQNDAEAVAWQWNNGSNWYTRPIYTAPPSSRMREALDDCRTHRTAWRNALELALKDNPPQAWDVDDALYWSHELEAFDRTFEALRAGDNHDSDGKESGGGTEGRAGRPWPSPKQDALVGEAMAPTMRPSPVAGINPGPSDPTPPDREAIARVVDKIRCGTRYGWRLDRNECVDFILALRGGE